MSPAEDGVALILLRNGFALARLRARINCNFSRRVAPEGLRDSPEVGRGESLLEFDSSMTVAMERDDFVEMARFLA